MDLNVSPSTQNQALSALLFLYRELLEREQELDGVVRTRTRRRLPVVLTPEEVRRFSGRIWLMAWAGAVAPCVGAQIPQRLGGLGLPMGVSASELLAQPEQR